MNRRQILLGTLGFGAAAVMAPLGLRPLSAQEGATEDGAPDPSTGRYPDEHMLGNPEAKVVFIEYASLSCPHCAHFHTTFLPQLRTDWIEPGKLLYIYRDFPLNAPALWAAMAANCLKGERYFAFLDILYKNQSSWLASDNVPAALFNYAQLAGLDQERFDQCVNDQAELDRILARVEYAQKTYDITGTPTLILNGQKVQPASYQELSDMIEAAQG